MYNFNISEMLDAFNNDPDELLNSFADAVSEEMNKRTQVNEISEEEADNNILIAADDVAVLWHDYIHYYLEQKRLTNTINADDLLISPESIVLFTNFIIDFYSNFKKDNK